MMKSSHIGKELRNRGHKFGEFKLQTMLKEFIPVRISGNNRSYDDWVVDTLDERLTKEKEAKLPQVEEVIPVKEETDLGEIKAMLSEICKRLAITL